MEYKLAEIIIGGANNLLLIITAYLSIVVAKHLLISKHEKEIMRVKRIVFSLIALGVVSIAFASLISNIGLLIPRNTVGTYWILDVFYIIGYVSFTAAFAYFWYSTSKAHKLHIKEPVFMLGVVCGVFIWLYYLFVYSIIPGSDTLSPASRAINYFYPIIVSVIFLLTLVVHPRMKAGVIRTPLWYISSGIFVYFIAYMMYVYSWWNFTNTFLPAASSVLMLVSSSYFTLGFFAAKKKFG